MTWKLCCRASWLMALLAALLAAAPVVAAEPAVPPPMAAPEDSGALLEAFASMPGFEARFEESKHLALLASPLKSAGKLYFEAPGHLARHVETPRPSTIVIGPDAIRITDAEGGDGTIDLSARPDIKGFVESFAWVLSGDAGKLSTVYTVTYAMAPERGAAAWTLTLAPKSRPLNQLIEAIVIQGEGLHVRTVTVTESSGDRSVITIRDADPTRRFSAEERKRLFGVSAK